MPVQRSTGLNNFPLRSVLTHVFLFLLQSNHRKQMPKSDSLSSLFRQEVLAMSAYKVADASNFIKLDAMENPYSWPAGITNQWLEKLRNCQLNRYPDPDAKKLIDRIKKHSQIPQDNQLLLGNGSDEIIQILQMAVPPESTVLSPEPGFVMYRQIAQCLGLKYQSVPLQVDTFELDMPAMLEAIEKHQPALIFLAYPNNPSGNLFDTQSIRKILSIATGLVIIDEAYAPFANASFIGALSEFSNLLIMRTFSKLGLAGLRLGFITGRPDIIEQLNKIRLPYNINSLSQVSADFALSNKALFEEQTQQICHDREKLFAQLNAIGGIKAYPSAANFILFRCEQNTAQQIFKCLKEQRILIKNLSPQGGLLQDCLRVTVGKPEENEAFITALKKV
jgi:histidinol-phosphate aminotransferase